MNRDELLAFIEKTSAEVAKMPAWKRGLLEASMKPMNDEPRKPITTKERAMKIEGVPEGYEVVRIGRPEKRELFIDSTGQVGTSNGLEVSYCFAIVRKIEKPKQYRPFANAEEFKPHRDRWLARNSSDGGMRVCEYSNDGVWLSSAIHLIEYKKAFKEYKFEDGTPFGVEVSEAIRAPITRPAQSY